jgi:hypothetical protein
VGCISKVQIVISRLIVGYKPSTESVTLYSTLASSLTSAESSSKQQLTSTITSRDSSIASTFEQTSDTLSTFAITKQLQQTSASLLSIATTAIFTTVSTSTIQQLNLSSVPAITTMSTPKPTFANVSLQPNGWKAPICANGEIGLNCTMNSDPCIMAKPCLNNGTCVSNNSNSYSCSCTQGFSGTYCEIDIQPCKSVTCLDHGVCIVQNLTSFKCICESGYEGDHCDILTDYCQGVVCDNNAQCRSSLLNFTCECLTNDFTGRYCETKSSSLAIHQIVNRSFGYVAILSIIFVAGTIILLDFLKFVFHIDPVRPQRDRLRRKRALAKKKHRTPQQPKIALRFTYVDTENNNSSTQAGNQIDGISHS